VGSDNLKGTLNARYVTKRTLGTFAPWHGYSVADSLSEKEYLFFALEAPSNVSISIEDCRMRDFLFSRSGRSRPGSLPPEIQWLHYLSAPVR